MSIHSLNEIRISRLAAWRLIGICCLLALANDLVSNFDGMTLLFVVQVVIVLGVAVLFLMPRLSRQNFLRPWVRSDTIACSSMTFESIILHRSRRR